MTCSSCTDSATPSAEPFVPVPLPQIPPFETKGSLQLTNTGNAFVDLSPVIPFAISAINAYITSLAVTQKSTEPIFFNAPYLYSLSNNLVLGNYLETSFTEGLLTTTTYLVPYQSEFKIETATIVTFFNSETKILFFQIPNEFSYNSLELAAVATATIESGYHAKIQIPQSFIIKNFLGESISLDVDIVIPLVQPSITSYTAQVTTSNNCDNVILGKTKLPAGKVCSNYNNDLNFDCNNAYWIEVGGKRCIDYFDGICFKYETIPTKYYTCRREQDGVAKNGVCRSSLNCSS